MPKRIISNNRIRAREVRLIGEDGSQLGVVKLELALKQSREAGLDLIQVTEKLDPPVCKIMNYGKYAYQQGKKNKKQKSAELKSIRLSFGISEHDMETRAKAAEKFLSKGSTLKIEMRLRGREKAHQDLARQNLEDFLKTIAIPYKLEQEVKKYPGGFNTIINPA